MAKVKIYFRQNSIDAYLKTIIPSRAKIEVGVQERKHLDVITGKESTTTQVGIAHEYGVGAPRRSFLRDPLRKFMPNIIRTANAEKFGTIKEMVDFIAQNMYSVVQGAFDTDGYGNWKSLNRTYGYVKKRTVGFIHPILNLTGALRDSLYVNYSLNKRAKIVPQLANTFTKKTSKTLGPRKLSNKWTEKVYGSVVNYFHSLGKGE